MAGLLDGRVAVVTGGASGIGRAIAHRVAEHGAKAVVVADVVEEPREGGTPTHRLIEETTEASAHFVACDVGRVSEVQAAVDAADEFGGVDLLVNDAGIFRQHDILEVTEEEYDEMMAINVKGVYFGAQQAARRMAANGGGDIINISSVGGLSGSGEFPTYSASKGAVRLLTYALADALGPRGIRVNAIHPGLIETEMTQTDVPIAESHDPSEVPLGRHGRPDDIAGAVIYLASDLASYVSGASILVDGGASGGQ